MTEQLRRILCEFDTRIAAAETEETRALLQSQKLLAELINARFAALETALDLLVIARRSSAA